MRDSAVRQGAEQQPNMFGGDPAPVYDYIWRWGNSKGSPLLNPRKGQRCRVLIWAKGMNSVLIEFEDGYRVNTSRNGIRKAPAERVRRLFGEQPNAQSGIDKPDSPAGVEGVRMFGNSVATNDPLTALYVLFGVGPHPSRRQVHRREEGEDP